MGPGAPDKSWGGVGTLDSVPPCHPQLWAPHLSHATANDKGKEMKSRATGEMSAQHVPPSPLCLQREAPPAEPVPALLTCCLGPLLP